MKRKEILNHIQKIEAIAGLQSTQDGKKAVYEEKFRELTEADKDEFSKMAKRKNAKSKLGQQCLKEEFAKKWKNVISEANNGKLIEIVKFNLGI